MLSSLRVGTHKANCSTNCSAEPAFRFCFFAVDFALGLTHNHRSSVSRRGLAMLPISSKNKAEAPVHLAALLFRARPANIRTSAVPRQPPSQTLKLGSAVGATTIQGGFRIGYRGIHFCGGQSTYELSGRRSSFSVGFCFASRSASRHPLVIRNRQRTSLRALASLLRAWRKPRRRLSEGGHDTDPPTAGSSLFAASTTLDRTVSIR